MTTFASGITVEVITVDGEDPDTVIEFTIGKNLSASDAIILTLLKAVMSLLVEFRRAHWRMIS